MRSANGPVKIKICGLRTLSDVQAVNEQLPEYTGFIFDPSRKRYISLEQAEELRRTLDARIRPVGVFVNAGAEEIRRVLEVCRLDMVQLHGQETDEDIRRLREEYERRWRPARGARRRIPEETMCRQIRSELCIVKAFRIENEEDVRKAEASAADEILLDHGAGGTGESFDWSLLKNCKRRFFLAGGLTPDNVQLAIEEAKPFAVDVSSSLETDGRKDPCKIRRFVTAVRGADEK